MAIIVDFKKLLPSNMREGKWGQFIEAYQAVVSDLKDEKIDSIINQFDINHMDETLLKNLITKLGWTLSTYDGWTNNLEYFKRQALTVTPRVLQKNNRPGYWNEFYIYNLWGDVYPLLQWVDDDYSLTPFLYWWESDENPNVIDILDSGDDNVQYLLPYTLDGLLGIDIGHTLDTYYPVYGNPQESGLVDGYLDTPGIIRMLDQESDLIYIVRQILINYHYKLVEDSGNFLSKLTMKAFNNDVNQIKRITEKVYFEPILDIYYHQNSGVATSTKYDDFDRNEDVGEQLTTWLDDNFDDVGFIQLGSGSLGLLSGTPTGVEYLVSTIDSFDEEISEFDADTGTWTYRKRLFENGTVPDFTELAVFNSASGCFLYSEFPAINFHTSGEMCGNIQFQFHDLDYTP